MIFVDRLKAKKGLKRLLAPFTIIHLLRARTLICAHVVRRVLSTQRGLKMLA